MLRLVIVKKKDLRINLYNSYNILNLALNITIKNIKKFKQYNNIDIESTNENILEMIQNRKLYNNKIKLTNKNDEKSIK